MTVNTSLQFVPELETARLEKLAHPSMTCTWVSPGESEKNHIAINSNEVRATQGPQGVLMTLRDFRKPKFIIHLNHKHCV